MGLGTFCWVFVALGISKGLSGSQWVLAGLAGSQRVLKGLGSSLLKGLRGSQYLKGSQLVLAGVCQSRWAWQGLPGLAESLQVLVVSVVFDISKSLSMSMRVLMGL